MAARPDQTDRDVRGADDRARTPARATLLRLAGWGAVAACALAAAVLTAQSDAGAKRIATVAGSSYSVETARIASSQALTSQALARVAEAEREAVRLAEAVRTLTADRDKLAARVASLESSLEDLTGSISLTQPSRRAPPATESLLGPPSPLRQPEPSRPPSAAPPPSAFAAVEPREALTQVASAAMPPNVTLDPPPTIGTDAIPLPRPKPAVAPQPAAAPDPIAAKRYGVELGGPAAADVLRVLWTRIREGQNGALVADLKPVIALREAAKPGLFEMRLVAGPVTTVAAANKLCASLSTGGVPCRSATLDGHLMELP